MNEICPGWVAGNHKEFVFSTELHNDSPFMHILYNFYLMSKCQIFRKIWWTYQDSISDDNEITQKQFVIEVWTPSFRDCFNLVMECSDGTAVITHIVDFFPKFDQEAIQEHLLALQKAISKSRSDYVSRVPSRTDWIYYASKKIDTYQQFKHYQETAVDLLKLKKCLQWKGNFNLLESIAEEVCLFHNYYCKVKEITFLEKVNFYFK